MDTSNGPLAVLLGVCAIALQRSARWHPLWHHCGVLLAITVYLANNSVHAESSSSEKCSADGAPDSTPEQADDSWHNLVRWVQSNKGYIHRGISPKMVSHGGFELQGIVADDTLDAGTELLRIPLRLCINDEVEANYSSSAESIAACAGHTMLKESPSIKLALEMKKGNESFFAPYFDILPSLMSFREFHPFLAGDSMQTAFVELPFINTFARYYKHLQMKLHNCMEAWTVREDNPSLSSLQADDIVHANMLWKTRCHGSDFESKCMLVPVVDLFNTAIETELNAAVQEYQDSHVSLKLTRRVYAGSEILVQYLARADNEHMLFKFGVYLESNPWRLNRFADATCSQHFQNEYGAESAAMSLRQLTLAELDLKQPPPPSWVSPRCVANAQPMRCLLARLAFETCSQAWGMSGWRQPASPDDKYWHDVQKYWRVKLGALLANEEKDAEGALEMLEAAHRIDPLDTDVTLDIATLRTILEDRKKPKEVTMGGLLDFIAKMRKYIYESSPSPASLLSMIYNA